MKVNLNITSLNIKSSLTVNRGVCDPNSWSNHFRHMKNSFANNLHIHNKLVKNETTLFWQTYSLIYVSDKSVLLLYKQEKIRKYYCSPPACNLRQIITFLAKPIYYDQ